MDPEEKEPEARSRWYRPSIITLICLVLILAGVMGMNTLALGKKPLPGNETRAAVPVVETVIAKSRDVVISVKGYGQALPVNCVDISSELAGTISCVSPNLVQGGQVKKDDILFEIDSRDYALAGKKADINVRVNENRVAQLKVQYKNDLSRLSHLKRTTELGRADHLRMKDLFEKEQVGTLAGVETAEKSYNTFLDSERTLKKAIELYPLQIKEAMESLESAIAGLETTNLDIERCTVRSPFNGRVREEFIEPGMYVSTGTKILTLADDSVLEILVSLSDDDSFTRLGLGESVSSGNWFSDLGARTCSVQTVTGKAVSTLPAAIDRIVRYDPLSRTLVLAVKISSSILQLEGRSFPIVDGMFCTVTIPGKTLHNTIKLPISAVNEDETIFIAENGLLRTVDVSVAMEDGDDVYVTGKIIDGTPVIATRLTNPMENQKVSFTETTVVARTGAL